MLVSSLAVCVCRVSDVDGMRSCLLVKLDERNLGVREIVEDGRDSAGVGHVEAIADNTCGVLVDDVGAAVALVGIAVVFSGGGVVSAGWLRN